MLKRAGRYEILAELGRGGFGQVYRAIDPTLDSVVAIKTLSVENDASVLARFRKEAAASRRLRHPNIVTIYDFGEQDGIPFIVMELLEGQDLQRILEGRKPLPLWHKIQIMTQVASGLAHAHAHGIVHRDVKPANIMLLPDGNIKIMDFGIALVSQDTNSRLTPRGAVIGTFRYMAPEHFRGSQQDARGDIFAYGLMLYELLSGIHPFHAPEPAAVMYNILNLDPVPIRDVCSECPEQVEAIITRLLQKDPDFRYQTLEDVMFDCEPILLDLKRDQARHLFENVKSAQESGQIETAQTLLRQVMELDPSYPGAREIREHLQAELRRTTVRPRVGALTAEGRQHLASGNPAEALLKFEAAVRLDPSDFILKSWLEQAKAALEQSRQLERLVADAERALLSGDLTGAHRIARQATELAPSEKRARDILAQTEAALGELQRQSRFDESISKARRLVEINSWDQAASLLDQLEREFPQRREIRVLREMLDAGRLAEQRQQKLSEGLHAARQDLQERRLEAARGRLATLHAEFPNAADVEQLLQYVTSEIDMENQRSVVDRSLSESRALAEKRSFAAAAAVLQAALNSYPTHSVLQREMQWVMTALQKAEREAALNQALSSAKALQAQRRFEEALGPLQIFALKHGADSTIAELRSEIERNREAARRAAELREMVLRVKNLLSQDKPQEASVLLEASPTPIKADPEITQLRTLAQAQLDRQAERRAALDQVLADVDAHRRRGDFNRALQILAAFTERHGADPKIGELEKSIRQEMEESQRRVEEFQRLIGRANELLSEGKAVEATQLLSSRAAYFRDDPQATGILAQADLQMRKNTEREEALQTAVASSVSSSQQSRFGEAKATLDAFMHQYGRDLRVDAQEQAVYRESEALIRRQIQARRFAEANRTIQEIAGWTPSPKVIDELQTTLRDAEQRELREVSYRERLAEAERALHAHQHRGAIERYTSLLAEFPGDAQVERGLQAATKARDLARKERLESEISRLKKLRLDGAAEEVRNSALRLLEEEEDHRVRKLLEWADATRGVPDSVSTTPTIKGWQWAIVGVTLCVVIIAWAIFTFVLPRPLRVDSAALNFTYGGITVPPPQSVSLTGGRRSPRLHSNTGWLTAVLENDSTPARVKVQVDPQGLKPGDYSGQLTIIAGNHASEAQAVTVNLRVDQLNARSHPATPSPAIVKVIPANIAFPNYQIGKTPPAPQTIVVTSENPSNGVDLSVTLANSCNWLKLSATHGLTPWSVESTVDIAKLRSGHTYTCTLSLRREGTSVSTAISASLTVVQPSVTALPPSASGEPASILSVSTSSLPFGTYQLSAAAPNAKSIFVTSSNPANGLPFAVVADGTCNWLSLSPASGNTSAQLSASVNISGLSVANYSCVIRIAAKTAGVSNPPPVIATLSVVAPKPKEPECTPESLDITKYNGERHGALRWIYTGELPARVTVHGRTASSGQVDGDSLPHWRTHIEIPEGVKIVQEPTNCNEWQLVFENPKALRVVEIRWTVY